MTLRSLSELKKQAASADGEQADAIVDEFLEDEHEEAIIEALEEGGNSAELRVRYHTSVSPATLEMAREKLKVHYANLGYTVVNLFFEEDLFLAIKW